MINTVPIRAEMAIAKGESVVLTKAQLDELLDEVEQGQRAKRELRIIDALKSTGIARVHRAP